MSKKLIFGSVAGLAVLGALVIVPLSASALTATNQVRAGGYGANGRGNGLTIKAQAVNMTTEQLKEKLQTKTMAEVISDQGLTTEQFQEKVRTAVQERWQEMGLSQEEIQERTQAQQERQANCDGTGTGQGGFRHGQNQ